MDKTETQAALNAAGLEQLVKNFDRLARTSIRLSTSPVDESTLKAGTSKLGGLPDLPAGTVWPEWKGVPQSFIAQFRLDDLHHYDIAHLLPQSGMLWFFYDSKQQTFGEAPEDRGGWQVLFKAGTLSDLQRVQPPASLPPEARFKACAVSFLNEITLPQNPQLDLPDLHWSDDDQGKYEDFLSNFPDPADRSAIHDRLLGHPETLQDDMRSQCQLVSHGVKDENDPKAADLLKGVSDWQLLFQVDSDEHAGMKWASSGMLYYWINAMDLKNQRFDATWLVLQSE